MLKFATVISVVTCSARSTPPRVRARRNDFLALGVLFLLITAPWFEAQASNHPPARHKVERVLPAEQEIEGDTVEWRLEFTIDVQISSTNAFYLKTVEFEPPAGNRRWDSGIVTYSKHNNSNKVYDVKFTNFGGREGVLAFGIDAQYITANGQNAVYNWTYRGDNSVRDTVQNAHYLVDNIHPTPEITGIPEEMKTLSHQVTFTFHEDVTGFALDDISSDNGTFSNFSKTSDRVYTADLTLARKDSVTVSVRANAAEDGRGNDSLASSFSATFDTSPPRVTSIERQDPTDYRTDANSLKWRVIFNEDVTGVAAEDFTVSGTTAGLSVNTSSGRQIDVTASGGDLENLDGVVRLSFKDGYTVTDIAGNALTNPTPTGSIKDSYSLDNTAPSVVSILRTTSNNTTPQKYETNAGSVWWRVTFSERVTGVEYSDFSLSGRDSVTGKTLFGGTGAWEVENSGGTQYRVHASGGDIPTFNGVMTLNLKTSHGIKDEFNRPLTTRTPTGVNENSFLLDRIRPTVTISGVPPVANSAFTATLRFSEAVEDFDVTDINATNATLSSFTATTEGQEWTVEVTPTANYQLAVAKDRARDAAGNGNTANDGSGASGTYGGVTARPETLTMDEGSSNSFTVVLDGAPTGDVAVALTSDNEDVKLDNGTLTFTTENWNQEQRVTVQALEDDADVAADFARVTVNPSGGGYDAVADETVAVTVTDNDAAGAGMTVSPQSLPISEGSLGSFRVVLNAVPTADVTVVLTSDNEAVTPGPRTLTFTTENWNAAQNVTVRALEDGDATDESATVTVNPSGGGYDAVADETVAVTVTDNDAAGAGVTVSPQSLALSEGSSGSFRVVLNAVPTGDVTVALTSDNEDVTLNNGTLTFTTANWNAVQTVTVRALEDGDATSDFARVTVDASGGGFDTVADETVAVTVTDNDAAGAGVTVSPESLTLPEGSSGNFRVVLNAVPTGDVTVALTSDNEDVTLNNGTLTFTTANWNAVQTVTVRALEDGDTTGESATVTVNPSGGGYNAVSDETVAVTVTDNDAAGAGVTVVPASLAMEEGDTETFTVVLDAEPMGPVVVTLASDHVEVTLEPKSLTFTTSNWFAVQTVTVTALEDVDTVNDSAGLTANPSGGGYDAVADGTVAATVTDNDDPLALAEIADKTYRQHREIEAWTLPAATGGGGGEVTYKLNPALPTGLVFDTATRRLSGLPTVAQGATEYSYSVTGADGSVVSRAFRMTVLEGPKPPTEEERRVVKAALTDVARSALSGVTEAMRGRFGGAGCVTALTLAGEEVKPVAAEAAAGREAREQRQGERGLEPREALGTSAFQWSPGCAGGEERVGQWTLWGRGDVRKFGGDVDQGSYEGTHLSGWVGVDRQLGKGLIAGAAVSQGSGRVKLDVGEGSAKLRADLTTAWPYMRVETEESGVFQLVLGAGRGTVTYDHLEREEEKADLELMVGSVSGTRQIWNRDGMTLWATGEGGMVQAKTSGTEGDALVGLRAEGWRLRGGMEGSFRALRLVGSEAALTPHGSAMVTHDGGGDVSGTGLELSAGARVETGNPRFGLSATAHWLALYSGGRERDWGGSVEAVWRADAEGRGLSLKLAPTWGVQASSTSAGVWEATDVFTSWQSRFDGGAALTSRLGYGVAMDGGTLTPFLEASLGGSGDGWRRMGAGAELKWQTGVAAAVVGEHDHDTDGAGDSRFRIDLRMRF